MNKSLFNLKCFKGEIAISGKRPNDLSEIEMNISELEEAINKYEDPTELRRQRDELLTVINDYLAWGAMTSSDRNLFENRFKQAVARCKPSGTEEA